MNTLKGNIWDYHQQGYITITTNGNLDKRGFAVMGRGIALQAKQKFPDLPKRLGEQIRKHGNLVYVWHDYKLVTFPTKTDYWKCSDLSLIESGLFQLTKLWNNSSITIQDKLFIPKLGCGYGQLSWTVIEPLMDRYLDDRFIVIDTH